jgi:hypothetical protein
MRRCVVKGGLVWDYILRFIRAFGIPGLGGSIVKIYREQVVSALLSFEAFLITKQFLFAENSILEKLNFSLFTLDLLSKESKLMQWMFFETRGDTFLREINMEHMRKLKASGSNSVVSFDNAVSQMYRSFVN